MAFFKKKLQDTADNSSTGTDAMTPNELLGYAKKNNINTSPLDVSRLTQSLGIIMRLEPMDGDKSGSLKKDKTGSWVMTVNSLHHPHRQRFTIAHELAHYIRHSLIVESFEDTVFFRDGKVTPMETEANKFAAELLMPEEAFAEYFELSGKVADIANHFQVSSMAVRLRAKQLGYDGHNL